MWHGLAIINKERGLTSHQVVARLRGILGQREIGHTGTLDPEAAGVLVVGLGEATRSFQFLNETVKIYAAEVVLGRETDTQDAEGTTLREVPGTWVTGSALTEAIAAMTGPVRQVPPMYSAVKMGGKKLYELARAGVTVERQARLIQVFEWTVTDLQPGYGFLERIYCRITCSKGTYIRTLIHDLGQRLGCGAHMGELIRLRSGDFQIEDGLTLSQVEALVKHGGFQAKLIPLSQGLAHLPSLQPEAADLSKVSHGGKLSYLKYPLNLAPGTYGKVLDQQLNVTAVVRLVAAEEYRYWQPVKVFQYRQ